jgi:integrase
MRRPTGTRVSAQSRPVFVVALETGQIDLAQGFIRVQMQKTKKFAVIRISRLCREALDECRRRSVVSRNVFATLEGKRVPEITVRRAFARVKRMAGITRRFRFHDLRPSAASNLAASVSLRNSASRHWRVENMNEIVSRCGASACSALDATDCSTG